MKKWFWISFLLLFVVGCQDEVMVEEEIPMLQVTIQTPEQLEVGEIKLRAEVLNGTKPVENADEVIFEVWKSGEFEQSVKIDGIYNDGVYEADYTFTEDGVYYMYAHTTAFNLHTMPKQQLIVGSPNMEDVKKDNSSAKMHH